MLRVQLIVAGVLLFQEQVGRDRTDTHIPSYTAPRSHTRHPLLILCPSRFYLSKSCGARVCRQCGRTRQ